MDTKEEKKMEILGFIFAIIVFCIFCGIFMRLGRIEQVLIKIAQSSPGYSKGGQKWER